MLKAVFRSGELIPIAEKILIDSPTSFSELAHLMPVEDVEEEHTAVEEYKGPTADDLRREAEAFKVHWEEEKEKMLSNAREEASRIIEDAQRAASREINSKTGEAQIIIQQAHDEALRIANEAKVQAAEYENQIRQSVDTEKKEALAAGNEQGRVEGYAEGKAEVDRLIERTQVVLERAQDKRGEILKETEKEIIDLVLLISRKIIKVISENQREVIISNVVEAMRKVRAKGSVIIRVNLADLKIATEHKQDYIRLLEGVNTINVVEDSSVDLGGCIIETDFGEIDARIASQLAELENKILEISPIRSRIKENLPPPIIRTANLNAGLSAASTLMNVLDTKNNEENEQITDDQSSDESVLPQGVNAALTASAALAAIATMATKGKRESDKIVAEKLENLGKKTET